MIQNWGFWVRCADHPPPSSKTPIRRSARAVRPWHPWRGHSLLQGCPVGGRRILRVFAGVSGIDGECFSWMGGGQQGGDRVAEKRKVGSSTLPLTTTPERRR